MEQTQIPPLEPINLTSNKDSRKKRASTLKRSERAARSVVNALCDLNPDAIGIVAEVFAKTSPRTARDFQESLSKALEA